MYGARFAEKRCAEGAEDGVRGDAGLEEARDGVSVIGANRRIRDEGDALRHLARSAVEPRIGAEAAQHRDKGVMEGRDRHGAERKALASPICRMALDAVVDEVEANFDSARPVRDERRRQPARVDIKRRVPGMVDPRRPREPVFADDLRVKAQRLAGLPPRRGRGCRGQGAAMAYRRCAEAGAAASASQTRAGEAGMSICATPRGRRASQTAFMIEVSEPAQPASPHPLTPSGLVVAG